MITNFQTTMALSWKDTFAALIFVHGVSVFYIFYLRQTFQQIRNNDESFQYELFKVAQAKGYYQPTQKATATEINTVKTQAQQ